MKLFKWEREAAVNVLKSLKRPSMGLVEEGIQAHPARCGIRGREREADRKRSVRRGGGLKSGSINLDKTGVFSFRRDVKCPCRYTVFEYIGGFGEAFP
jgi:hypothetical protein